MYLGRQSQNVNTALITAIGASQAISGEIVLERLLKKVIGTILENTGAQKGFLVLEEEGVLSVEARAMVDRGASMVSPSVPLERCADLSEAIVRYVARAREQLVLNDASREGPFAEDPYVVRHQPRSILCSPIVHQGQLSAILYLENNLSTGAFTPERLEVVSLLSSQAAISIENASLYEALEKKIEERTEAHRVNNQELEEANRKLEEFNVVLADAAHKIQLASQAKSDFLANMSHELRTPLNSIIGFTNVLGKNRADNLSQQDLTYLERILANGKHLLELINDILDLSKIEAGHMEMQIGAVSLAELVRETVGLMEGRLVDSQVELRAEVPASMAPLETDAEKLKQILINLIGNAVKFTEQGHVTVRVAADGAVQRPKRIDVIDTGIGIPADKLQSIFQAFQQADNTTARKYGGTGLGLAISRSLAELLGFELEVRSEVGKGSTFTLVLGDRAGAPMPAA